MQMSYWCTKGTVNQNVLEILLIFSILESNSATLARYADRLFEAFCVSKWAPSSCEKNRNRNYLWAQCRCITLIFAWSGQTGQVQSGRINSGLFNSFTLFFTVWNILAFWWDKLRPLHGLCIRPNHQKLGLLQWSIDYVTRTGRKRCQISLYFVLQKVTHFNQFILYLFYRTTKLIFYLGKIHTLLLFKWQVRWNKNAPKITLGKMFIGRHPCPNIRIWWAWPMMI